MEDSKVFTFRLELDLVARLDRYAEYLEKTTPGVKFSRTNALRHLIAIGLLNAEAKEDFAPLLVPAKKTAKKKEATR